MRFTPDRITHLELNEVFVVGTNRAGRHGRGAAKDALKWGARPGQGEGLMGQTYGIPTKGRRLEVLSVREIGLAVDRFIRFASGDQGRGLIFLLTPIGTGLAGYSPRDIAPLFRAALGVPNIILPRSFWQYLQDGSL